MKHLWVAAVVVALAGGGRAADPPPEKTGLKVGEKAPAFALKDQTGTERKLEDLLKEGEKLAIVFHRSAGW